MTSNPDDIRRDIERTRADLSHNVNALADQANPANIARRQVDKVTGGARDLKTRIFGDPHDPWDDGAVGDVQHRAAGAVEDARVAAAGAVGDAKDAVQDAPRQVRRQTQGNPLAAGLIAFGLGALVGGLVPSTRAEQDWATTAKDKAEPLVEEAKAMAQEAAEHLKPAAQQAADTLKDAATAAGEHVRDDAQVAADDVRSQAELAADQAKADPRNPL